MIIVEPSKTNHSTIGRGRRRQNSAIWRILGLGAILHILAVGIVAQNLVSGPPAPLLNGLDPLMLALMAKWHIPGGALAITKDGRLVFAHGYSTGAEAVQPDSLFRIASITKPFTAAAILKLIEQGKLTLTTPAFSLLSDLTPPPGAVVDSRISQITIQNLLEHKGGWDRDIAGDPPFLYPVTAATTFGVPPPATPDVLIRYMKGKPLQYDPGTTYAYSNFGYIVLGSIIEHVSGQSYADFVRNYILTPAGIQRMHPGASLPAGRLADEVTYYNYPGAPLASSIFPPVGSQVPSPYGGFSVELMLANGGWIASTMDLLRYADNINGQLGPAILQSPPSGFVGYVPPVGKGWGWVFDGSLPGTSTILHLDTGFKINGKVTYAVLFNSRQAGSPSPDVIADADSQLLQALQGIQNWPSGDLFSIYSGTNSACDFALSGTSTAASENGGNGTVAITAQNYCSWMATSSVPWLTIKSGQSGVGSGTVAYNASPNLTGTARSGILSIGGLSYTVQQSGGLANVGSIAQIASEGTWKTTFDFLNLGSSPAQMEVTFSDDVGNPLSLPLAFPQVLTGPVVASTLDRTLNPNAQIVMESTGPDNAATLVGSGQLLSNGNVTGFGIFSNQKTNWNAVVPLETRNAGRYLLAFDNTGTLTTGVAVASLTAQAINVPVIIRDDAGALIGNPTIPLSALGHTSFMLNDPQLGFQVTNGKRGTIEFDAPPGAQVSVLGLRANGPALTTLPVLANVGTSGGSITHVAYHNGWTSAFYLVNSGNASAQFTLSFFDENGIALAVPLLLPQAGTSTTTSTLTRTLAAGAMLVVNTQAQDAQSLVIGSAQLTTTGNISGFEVFRWITFGQEASVPLETRAPNSFVLVFDDTNGLTTGVALASASGLPANITATFRDDSGTQLGTPATISLVANGHTSFLLPDRYPSAAGKRGMVEFTVPKGTNISVIGFRAKSDGTLTTIPVLAK